MTSMRTREGDDSRQPGRQDSPDQGRFSPDEYPRTMRVQRFLARAGVASRRGSENLMTAGRVRVNGQVVTELGSKVDPDKDAVTVDGRPVSLKDDYCYLVLNKPAGYVTTMMDPQGRPCVAEMVPTRKYPGLFPVGRLDEDTTGLLFFTTNGELGNVMLRPASHVWKHYVALVRGRLSEQDIKRLSEGLRIGDDFAQPAKVQVMDEGDDRILPVAWEGIPYGTTVVGLTIHEGKRHQVKRMLKAVGHPVMRLHRDEFGPLKLGSLLPGQTRMLDPRERAAVEALLTNRPENLPPVRPTDPPKGPQRAHGPENPTRDSRGPRKLQGQHSHRSKRQNPYKKGEGTRRAR